MAVYSFEMIRLLPSWLLHIFNSLKYNYNGDETIIYYDI